ncbi:MAG TPA: HAMP domain-containing sensor histidine kinase [Planctomycetota bacterium]|nr:HAMP domain-containing sensor histidine kinase [Planctomycetota bacterium]
MTRLFLLTTTVLVLGVTTTSFWFLERSVESELDAQTVSTIKEYRLEYEKRWRTLKTADSTDIDTVLDAAFWESITRAVESNQTYPSAWRVWKVDWGTVAFESGDPKLLSEKFPRLTSYLDTLHLPEGRRTRTELLSHGYAVGVVLDGSERIEVLRRYETFAAVLMAVAALVTLGLGVYMIRSMSRMLRVVADRARAVREPTSASVELEDEDAPEEIRDVVDALRQLFTNVRSESERSRVFYASMAHELRSPIQNLVGETEVALFAKREGSDYRRVLESNLEELRDLGDAIDNLVTICSQRRPLSADSDLEDFDLLDEARIRLARERNQAERRGVEVAVEGQGDLSVRGDREGLLRALRNLAANAIQWSPVGCTVSVRLVGAEDTIDVTVDDAGPGVPPELREEIFAPFVRGPALNGQRIGYGLGLAIVRSAVDAQGGTIEVGTSDLGGARFHVVLPRTARPRE